jgi:prephenate dehydratase
VSTSRQKPRVAFQGEHGAFSEEAALKLLGNDIDLVPQKTFGDLFDSFRNGLADYLVAPVENSIAGIVEPSVRRIRASSLVILDEVEIQIDQHLIGCPGAALDTIATVQSHPMALAQCKHFFELHPKIKSIVADDTAGSVAEVVEHGDQTAAAIAGRHAAEIYGGEIILENIQDQTRNQTRFVLLSVKEHES